MTMAQTGAVDEGLLKLGNARSLYEQIVAVNPQMRFRTDLATDEILIGDTLVTGGRHEDAIKSYRQALEITRKLVAEDPKDTAHKRHLNDVLMRLATTLYNIGKRDQAIEKAGG